MSRDHVGIPKFIQKGFSNNDTVFVFNKKKKFYTSSIANLGIENDYYDEDVESDLLANQIEYNFSVFYKDFCNIKDPIIMKNLLDKNIKLVEQFFSFMFMRTKKVFDLVKNESLTSKFFGDFTHSDLLRIQTILNINPLKIIGDNYNFYPVVNLSQIPFINNSIGFGFLTDTQSKNSIIIPLNIRIAILISCNRNFVRDNFYIITSNFDKKVDSINKCMIITEREFGNGFFFGNNKKVIEHYATYKENCL